MGNSTPDPEDIEHYRRQAEQTSAKVKDGGLEGAATKSCARECEEAAIALLKAAVKEAARGKPDSTSVYAHAAGELVRAVAKLRAVGM